MKNYLYLILWIVYFTFFFYYKDSYIFIFIKDNIVYWETILSYFNAIVGIITSLWIIGIFIKYLELILNKLFTKTISKYDDIIWTFIINFIKVSKYILAIYIWIYLAIIPDFFQLVIDKIFNVSFIFAFLILINGLIKDIFDTIWKNWKFTWLSSQVFPMVSKIIIVFIWIIWTITIIWNLGYNVWALITWAWVWWLAIALAAQKSVANIFWAISVIINKPFKVWELISINWHTWVVKEIGLTYLTLRDTTWYKILIPNETIISSAVENKSIRDNRRTDFTIWVTYDTTWLKMKKGVSIIENILEKYVKDWTISKYRVNFDSFWDFSLNISATYFSLVNNDYTAYLKQKQEINLEIKLLFEKSKIDMAFPTQEVILHNKNGI